MRPPPRRFWLGGSEAERSVSPRSRKVAGRRTSSPHRSLTSSSIGEGTDGRRVSARLGFVPRGRLPPAVVACRAGVRPGAGRVAAVVVGLAVSKQASVPAAAPPSGGSSALAEAESLILAQNERWRRA